MANPNEDVIKAAGRIMAHSGIAGLSLDALKKEFSMARKRFPRGINNDGDLFELMLLDFEEKLRALVSEISLKNNHPDQEITLLFKGLYDMFKQHQWYLDLVFDKSLLLRCRKADDILFRVRRVAKSYLTRLIQRGKHNGQFASTESTYVLVNEILESFRALMNDWQLTEKMIKDIRYAQKVKD
ncbi:hypothetical protein MASR1M74_25640 [Lentimicrobium sp.]